MRSVQKTDQHASSHYTNMQIEWKCAGCSVLQLCLCLSVQIENIDVCLTFLAAKGVNIQGLSAEGKLDSCTTSFTGTGEVDPDLGQASSYLTNVLHAMG